MDNQKPVSPETDADEPKVFKIASPGGRRAFLQTLSRTAAVGGAAVAADNCNSKAPTTPSPPPTTSTTSSVRTTTTSTVLPASTLAGVVTDANTGRPVGGARVAVVDGPGAGRSSTTDGNGYYSIAGISHSSFTARATATNYSNQDKGLTLSQDTRLDFTLRPLAATTSTVPATTTSGGCASNFCTCNPQTRTYFYPN